jgi:mannose-6-phosphate isomerase
VFAAAHAHRFGWRGDVSRVVRNGLTCLDARFRRADGLYRTLIAADGAILDDRALLYDQAFVLLGFAAAAQALDTVPELEQRALDLRTHVERAWRSADGGFASGDGLADRRESNPHMHLLEACLAWADVGSDRTWGTWATEIAELAVARFIDPNSGVLVERRTERWVPAADHDGHRVEPGHLFEWAWLLLRAARGERTAKFAAALRLIDLGESAGVRNGVAVNALLDDLTVYDGNARLWPQTERLKAALLARAVTGEARFTAVAADAAASLMPYLDTAVAGLWFDERSPSGNFPPGPAPASTLYHLVSAIGALRGD